MMSAALAGPAAPTWSRDPSGWRMEARPNARCREFISRDIDPAIGGLVLTSDSGNAREILR